MGVDVSIVRALLNACSFFGSQLLSKDATFILLQSTKKEKINDKLAEIFAKIGSKENTREVSGVQSAVMDY